MNVSSLLLSSGFVNTPFLCSLKNRIKLSRLFFFPLPCLSVAHSALRRFNTFPFFFFFFPFLVCVFIVVFFPVVVFTGDVVILFVEEQ